MCFVGNFVEGFALVLVMLDPLDVAFGYTADIVDSEIVGAEVVVAVNVENDFADVVVVGIDFVDVVVFETEGTDLVIVLVAADILRKAMCNALHLCVFCIQ